MDTTTWRRSILRQHGRRTKRPFAPFVNTFFAEAISRTKFFRHMF
jgi:hypothetical protein